MINAFDYFRTESDDVFIAGADKLVDGHIYGVHVYEPDEDGCRSCGGQSFSKADRSSSSLGLDFTSSNNLFQDGFMIDNEVIEEIRSPEDERDNILNNDLENWEKEAYETLSEVFGGDVYLVGSQIWGLSTENSDIDFLLCSNNENDFEGVFNDFADESGYEMLDKQSIRGKAEKYSDRYNIPVDAAEHHLCSPNRRVKSNENNQKLSLITAQLPGTHTDYAFPDNVGDKGQTVEDEGIVVDASDGHKRPRVYELSLNDIGDVDIVSDRWIDAGSFSEGDEIVLKGDYFSEPNTVYLSSENSYFESNDHF